MVEVMVVPTLLPMMMGTPCLNFKGPVLQNFAMLKLMIMLKEP
jgi:hypothetical protein